MKVKVSEATGPVLDWMVAKAEGLTYRNDEKYGPMCFRPSTVKGAVHWDSKPLPYSSDWSQGGPIIEREKISLRPIVQQGHALDGQWLAAFDHGNTGTLARWVKRSDFRGHYRQGPTPLIAAMRCFVASKLGDEADVPEELIK